MAFKTTQQLQVGRILATGQQVDVGVLAQNKQGVYFQYSADYLEQFGSRQLWWCKAQSTSLYGTGR